MTATNPSLDSETLAAVTDPLHRIASAITWPSDNGSGGHGRSLTEAVQDVAAGLHAIATALDGLAATIAYKE